MVEDELAPIEAGELSSSVGQGFVSGVLYGALEGALTCTYGDDVVTVPLPGWSASAIELIVRGLHFGDWTEFQAMMEGGNEGLEEPSGSADVPRRRPRTECKGCGRLGSFLRAALLFLVWFCWGCVKAVEAGSVEPWGPQEKQCWDEVSSQAVVLRPRDQDVIEPWEGGEGCDGSWLFEICRVFLIIMTWELAKAGVGFFKAPRATFKAEGTQTQDSGVIELPLSSQVRNRARILYHLWRAGHRVEIEEYSGRVRSEFEGLIGAWLTRVEEGDVSSVSSSDSGVE